MPIQYIIIIKYLYCFCLILLISCVCFFSETVLPFGYMQICYFYYSIAPADFVKQRIKIEATVWLSQQFVPVISAEQLQTKEKHHNYHSHSCGQILATHVRGNIRSPACSATSPVNPNSNSSDWVNLKYLSVRLNFLTQLGTSILSKSIICCKTSQNLVLTISRTQRVEELLFGIFSSSPDLTKLLQFLKSEILLAYSKKFICNGSLDLT